ncbi:hypothetical protein ABLE91_28345 [Aquabacter sp. CN5-332]|uniref:hypothetical protein n=1 Tax=Aquabacter sp. CN5-332 TaxID=3156608 RepID=UPI0032B53A1E
MTDRRHEALNMAGRVVAAWHLDMLLWPTIRLDRPGRTVVLDPHFNSEEAEETNAEYVGSEYFTNAGCIAEMAGEEAESLLAGTIEADVETHYAEIARPLSDNDADAAAELLEIQRTAAKAIVQAGKAAIDRIANALVDRGEISAGELSEMLDAPLQ